jgi:hypothetical protein
MPNRQVSRVVGGVLMVLSLSALALVLVGLAQPPQPPRTDEGALARLFQLTIGALVPTAILYLLTADWRHREQSARALVISGVAVILAFGALYFGENLR